MRFLTIAALAALLGACATTYDAAELADMSAAEIERRKDHPVEARVHVRSFTLPMDVDQAYRQFLRGARKCWQAPSSLLFPGVLLEEDAFNAQAGYARASMRFMGAIRVVVTMRPAGHGGTAVDMRTVFTADYLDNITPWFTASAVECVLPEAAQPKPDQSRQRY